MTIPNLTRGHIKVRPSEGLLLTFDPTWEDTVKVPAIIYIYLPTKRRKKKIKK